jgi:hypothetical protein
VSSIRQVWDHLEATADPADVFLALHPLLRAIGASSPADTDAPTERADALAIQGSGFGELEDEVCKALHECGRVDVAAIRPLLGDSDAQLAAVSLAVLVGIDLACAVIHPRSPGARAGLHEMSSRPWVNPCKGTLNASHSDPATDGALLFRHAVASDLEVVEPPHPFEHVFNNLVAVRAETWNQAAHWAHVEWLDDPELSDPELELGCAPLLTSPREVQWTSRCEEGTHYCQPQPSTQLVKSRIRELLDRIEMAGVRIAMLPERTLSCDLLDEWRAALSERQLRYLRWILVGSGTTDAASRVNVAKILTFDGSDLFEQAKCTRFTFDNDRLHEWGLLGWVSGSPPIVEDLDQGEQITIAETAFGRLAVLIAEDLTEVDREILIEHGVSVVFAPVLCEPGLACQLDGAESLAKRIGTRTILSNSLVIAGAQGMSGPAPVCMAIDGSGPGRPLMASEAQEVKRIPVHPAH